MRENILEVRKILKKFGDLKAVDNISFDVKKGSLFAFLGPNGAGKSTTIKILTTILKADSGVFSVDGSSLEKDIRNKIGVVFQENVLDDLLTVKENLLYRGGLYIENTKKLNDRYEYLEEKLNLEEIKDRKFKNLSGGQKRRVEIARALFSSPVILLLDEPTTGLDPETRKQVWNTLEKLKKEENMTIFLTTHYMEEASDADYIVIIDKGVIKVSGTPSELKSKYSKDFLKIVPFSKNEFESILKNKSINYQKIADQYVIEISSTEKAINYIIELKEEIKQFEVLKGNLDDVFINIIGDKNEPNN